MVVVVTERCNGGPFECAKPRARRKGHGGQEPTACLILDVRLPGMSGVELYKQLPLSLRSIPTIFITAHAVPEMHIWATKPGVIAVLYKPFQPEVLLQAVRKAITITHLGRSKQCL